MNVITCGGTESPAAVLPAGDTLAPLHHLAHQLPPVGHGRDGGPDLAAAGARRGHVLPHALLQPLVGDGPAAAHLELEVDLLADGHGLQRVLGQLGLGLDDHLVPVPAHGVHLVQGAAAHAHGGAGVHTDNKIL